MSYQRLTIPQEEALRKEVKQLRIKLGWLDKYKKLYRDLKQKFLETEHQYKSEIDKLKTQLSTQEEKIKQLELNMSSYQNTLFKHHKSRKEDIPSKTSNPEKRKVGAQKGHQGITRIKKSPDYIKEAYYERCPDCGEGLKPSQKYKSHTVEDIPLEEIKVITTEYRSQRQWCRNCRKEQVANPAGVIPNSKFGINLFTLTLILKYKSHQSYNQIKELYNTVYGLKITTGALINHVNKSKEYFNDYYEEIRGSPIKHSDETTWYLNGQPVWLWGLITATVTYLQIEDSRGKGVINKLLTTPKLTDILVRDDYACYTSLEMQHQSCWSHLLRKAREYAENTASSKEIKDLYVELRVIFADLDFLCKETFDPEKRQKEYKKYSDKIEEISGRNYTSLEAGRVQKRIARQGNNLITALINEGVPLTNNLAEQQLRPSVINRKISYGSRSHTGTEAFAVNMSVIQTIQRSNKPVIPQIKALLTGKG